MLDTDRLTPARPPARPPADIETTLTPGTGTFSLTGQLGSVISESAHVALAWVKAHAFELGIAPDRDANAFDKRDVHVHFPAGAVKKDGPSAGVALVVAIVSLSASRHLPSVCLCPGARPPQLGERSTS